MIYLEFNATKIRQTFERGREWRVARGDGYLRMIRQVSKQVNEGFEDLVFFLVVTENACGYKSTRGFLAGDKK